MLGFSPLASEALADSGAPSVVIVSSSVVAISGLRVVNRVAVVSGASTIAALSISTFSRLADVSSVSVLGASSISTFSRAAATNSLSTIDLDYVILNMSRRDRSLTVLVDEQNRSLLIPGSKP
jgi:hypothetical protein